MISFFVAGIPKALSVGKSVRVPNQGGGFKQFQKRVNTDWSTLVGMIGREHAPDAPLAGALRFRATFRMPRPASGRKAIHPLKRPDVDNLAHKLSDQFNGVFWLDDSQIVEMVIRKRFADVDEPPGVQIDVERVA